MDIASSVIKFTGTDGVNTFVRPKLRAEPISPVQRVRRVEGGFKEKMPSPDFNIQSEKFERNGFNHLGRYLDVYA